MEYIIYSENIKCAGCVSNIKNALGELDGVHAVSVAIESGRITIDADDNLRTRIVTALASSGHPEKPRT